MRGDAPLFFSWLQGCLIGSVNDVSGGLIKTKGPPPSEEISFGSSVKSWIIILPFGHEKSSFVLLFYFSTSSSPFCAHPRSHLSRRILSHDPYIFAPCLKSHGGLVLRIPLTGTSPAHACPLSPPSSSLPKSFLSGSQLAWRAFDSSSTPIINVLTTIKPYQSATAAYTHCQNRVTTPIHDTIHEH